MSDDLVNRFIKDVCFVLGIDVPKVTHDFLDTVVFVISKFPNRLYRS